MLASNYVLEEDPGSILPLVFYVTLFGFVVKMIMNITFGVLFLTMITKDPGY